MPAVTEERVKAFAHCVDSRCRGNKQEPVDAIVAETTWSYSETGGDGMFGHPERTTRYLRFADPDEGKCACGRNREISETPRIQLDDSGYDPGALLDIEPEQRDPDAYKRGKGHVVVADDTRTAALEDENTELKERLAKLEGYMLGKQSAEAEWADPPALSPEQQEEVGKVHTYEDPEA